jgi:CheY-like chemotaxis protein
VSIDAVLADVANWLAPLAERSSIQLRVEASGGWVTADAQRLRQIVVNLASDAIKYGSPGGTVWLRSRPDPGEAETGAAAPGWYLCVCDDGRGLTATEREHLADSYDRLDRAPEPGHAAGVGLTIVRRLAEFMGGRLDVVSAGGPGSEFRVWLPRAAAPEPPKPAPADADGATRLTIHYIEDNPVNVILVKELVAMRPEVGLVCSVDGESGVEQALADRPDVVLIDMQLPDIDGYEVLKRLRAAPDLAGSSMIALSANGMSDDIARAKEAGFDDYWTKPIDFRRFLSALDKLSAAKTATT